MKYIVTGFLIASWPKVHNFVIFMVLAVKFHVEINSHPHLPPLQVKLE